MGLQAPDPAVTIAGPLINGEETVISLLSPSELKSRPYLGNLRQLINIGFATTHKPYFDLDGGQDSKASEQFSRVSDIIAELQPEFFTYLVYSK